MAFIHFLPFMIVFTALWIVIRAVVCLRQKRVDWRREAVLHLNTLGVCLGLCRGSFFARHPPPDRTLPDSAAS